MSSRDYQPRHDTSVVADLARYEPMLGALEEKYWNALKDPQSAATWGNASKFVAAILESIEEGPRVFGRSRKFRICDVWCEWLYRPTFIPDEDYPFGQVTCHLPGQEHRKFFEFAFDLNGKFGRDIANISASRISEPADAAFLFADLIAAFIAAALGPRTRNENSYLP